MTPLDTAADTLDSAAAELERAARHARQAAHHLRAREVPRGCAHVVASEGHIRMAVEALDSFKVQHARVAVVD